MKLIYEYIRNIILEGRIEDIKEKYPQWGNLKMFINNDPSVNNKYLMWMVKQADIIFDAGGWNKYTKEKLYELIKSFHSNLQRLKGTERDINSYKTLEDLQITLSRLGDKSKSQQKKEIKSKEANVVFENKKVIVVEPKSHKASCYYGSGTKWCTTEKSSGNWDSYFLDDNVTFYYILNKTLDKDNPLYKVAVAVYQTGKYEIYDSSDKLKSVSIMNKYFKRIGIPENIFTHKNKNGVYVNGTGAKIWFKNGKFHREDGPAVERANGSKYWYLNGQLHREDGPAYERANGTKHWYLNSQLHREDGPAVELSNGSKYWYLNNVLHREDGPADERASGDKFWWQHGKRHREDGPAIEWSNGNKSWYLNGINYTEDEWKNKMDKE